MTKEIKVTVDLINVLTPEGVEAVWTQCRQESYTARQLVSRIPKYFENIRAEKTAGYRFISKVTLLEKVPEAVGEQFQKEFCRSLKKAGKLVLRTHGI